MKKNENIEDKKIFAFINLDAGVREILLKNDYLNAKKVCDAYPENHKIQSRLYRFLFSKGCYEEICKLSKKYIDNDLIIRSQYIGASIKLNNLIEAKEVAESTVGYSESIAVQLTKIYAMLTLENKLSEEVLVSFYNKNKFNLKINNVMCNYYKKIKEYNKVIEICDKYPDDYILLLQKAECLLILGFYEEVMDICDYTLNKFGENDLAAKLFIEASNKSNTRI